jgi:hypothetical protein
MFNPLNNKMVLQTIMNKVEVELNNALIFRKKQFNDNTLFFTVEIDTNLQKPMISLRKPADETLVKMTANELIRDENIKKQLDKIPAFLKSLINFDKIILKIENKLKEKLKENHRLKISENKIKAKIDLHSGENLLIENIDLYQFFIQ